MMLITAVPYQPNITVLDYKILIYYGRNYGRNTAENSQGLRSNFCLEKRCLLRSLSKFKITYSCLRIIIGSVVLAPQTCLLSFVRRTRLRLILLSFATLQLAKLEPF
jgi:hypothetical protein